MYFSAQKFYHENIFAMFTAKLIGLLSVLAVPSILKVLMHTRESSSPMTAYRRYMATIFHTMSWYDEELIEGSRQVKCISASSFYSKLFSIIRSWKSLEAVRKRHVRVSLQSIKSNVGMISQKDMALTQFGFVGLVHVTSFWFFKFIS